MAVRFDRNAVPDKRANTNLNEGAATEMTEGEACPDEKRSADIEPSATARPFYPVPTSQWLSPPFLDPATSAIIGIGLMSHRGNVGLVISRARRINDSIYFP